MAMIEKGDRGKCPHCGTAVQFTPGLTEHLIPMHGEPRVEYSDYGFHSLVYKYGEESNLKLSVVECPSCSQIVISADLPGPVLGEKLQTRIQPVLWPNRPSISIPEEVPAHIATDYLEAVTVRDLSPRAAAALARRCLQSTLIHAGKVRENADLAQQIEEVLPDLPGYLGDDVDAIRNVGNFAAHPLKSKEPERLLDVEEDELEWSLEVLARLFDFYYVSRPRSESRRARLNEKLESAGKPPLKKRDRD
ncbi:MAG TPA: DUF4145 domain-containing protein [Gemmatimonadota bacterium]|nr:DUF4145 domain-containing protein [Gemmatimonadota bacterium]